MKAGNYRVYGEGTIQLQHIKTGSSLFIAAPGAPHAAPGPPHAATQPHSSTLPSIKCAETACILIRAHQGM